jgi:hypothetical protein
LQRNTLYYLSKFSQKTMDTPATAEARLQAEIEALRARYADTQDLYREVCVVLFFRHGITPTANKLYQLVRKGSMSAPAEALNRFWETLREKSRIRIEHPDLPQSLQDATGEMIGALWQRAQAEAHSVVGALRAEAQSQIIAAQESEYAATARLREVEAALGEQTQSSQTMGQQLAGLQAELARAQGESTSLQRQIDTEVAQRRELQESLQVAQQRFNHELEQQRALSTSMEERHASEVRRLQLDVDRERVHATRLQKDLGLSQRVQADQADLHRQQGREKQEQADALRQRNGELEGSLAELRGQRDHLLTDIANLRLRLESKPSAKKAALSQVIAMIDPGRAPRRVDNAKANYPSFIHKTQQP